MNDSIGALDWTTTVPLLVGGLISLVSSLVMFGLAEYLAFRSKQSEAKRTEAMNAYRDLQKLTGTYNAIENLGRHLDREFARAGDFDLESGPSAFLRPIVGARQIIEDVTVNEMRFLMHGDGELPARVWEIQQRARNNDFVIDYYNKLKVDFGEFLCANPQFIKGIDGSELSLEIGSDLAKVAHVKIGEMNQIIGSLVEAVEEDRRSAVSIINDFISQARVVYGDDFPAKGLEIRGGK